MEKLLQIIKGMKILLTKCVFYLQCVLRVVKKIHSIARNKSNRADRHSELKKGSEINANQEQTSDT